MFLIPPNDTQLEFIKKEECYQSADSLDQDVTQLIDWLSKQPHLPNITDRKWLTHFIIGCKYSLLRTKQVIDTYFCVRAEFPEFFGGYTREMILEIAKNGKISAVPKLTPEGHRVLITRSIQSDDENFDVELYCKMNLIALDLQVKEEPVYGNIILFDVKNFSLSQFLAFTPTVTKNFMKCCIDAFPLRVKAVHYINPPKFMSRLVTFFKMFVSNKIKERIFVHDTLEDLYKVVPKENLPDAYGGTAGSLDKMEADFIEFMVDNQEWIAQKPTADLSKRPEQSKTEDMNGTFKQLQID